jgi:hypothetical protein
MNWLGRVYAILLVALLALSSLIMVESANAQSIPKPSVPEFTIQLTVHSYGTPETHSIDPYTGENITTPATHTETKSLDFKIKNQPFASPGENWDNSGGVYMVDFGVYYNIRYKGHYEDSWKERYDSWACPSQDSSSDYTILSFYADDDGAILGGDYYVYGTVDFQVKAMMGHAVDKLELYYHIYEFVGTESDWSPTQTITFKDKATLTPIPTVPSNGALSIAISPDLAVALALIAVSISVVVAISLLLYMRQLKRNIVKPDNSAA